MVQGWVDVLVVGAGPVGLFCANELARHGLSCRIIDKKSELSDKSKALGIHIRTLDVLEDCGFIEDFLSQGDKVHGAILKSSGHQIASLDFKHIGASRDFLIDLPQDKSERIFFQGLVDKGIKVAWQSELIAIEQESQGVMALVKKKNGSQEQIKAHWLIACDGAHSTVRSLIGADFIGASYPQTWWLADLHIDWALPEDKMVINASPKGPLACFPMGNSRYRLVLTAPNDESAPTMADIEQAFHERSSDVAILSDPIWITPFSIHHRQIQQYRHNRLFFAGDAAHIHSPMGGQGLNTGIQDIYNLVWKLALVQKRLSKNTLLDSYHAERYPIGKAVLEKTDRMTKMVLIQNPLLIALRNHFIRFFSTFSRIRNHLAKDLAELNLSYANSPIVKKIGKKTGIKVGEYLPTMHFKNVVERTHLTLEEISEGIKHHLFLFVGLENRVTKISMKAAVLTPKFKDVLDVHLILLDTPSVYPDSLSLWVDLNQSVHKAFRFDEPTALLIRPDKYVGLVQSPINLAELQAWLHGLFII
jgi:2-polyprenyl-6-methoxyphenol hydroxylase-like FAD-dependent oxidoreductase